MPALFEISKPEKIERIMVFKELHKLPDYLRRIPEYIPNECEKVVVLAENNNGFLKVRIGSKNNLISNLSMRYFRTIKTHQMRERLKQRPASAAIERLLKKL